MHGATKGTYTLVAADVGKTIGLTVRATDSTGTTPAYASLAGLVAAKSAALAATAQPTLGGHGGGRPGPHGRRPAPGRASTPTTFTYAWLRCNANGRLCVAIAGRDGRDATR